MVVKHNLPITMDDIEETVAVDTNTEVEEATDSNEDSDEETQEIEETQEDTIDSAELEALKTAKAQLTARAKKAEEEIKKLKESKAEPQNINSDPYFADELRLISQGVVGQAILKAKIIAKGSGVSLLDAMKDEAVVAYIKDIKEQEKREKAKLGASKGSGESADSTLIKPGMSREEHEEAFKKVMGKVVT